MPDWLAKAGEHIPPLVAGGAGGLVRWLTLKEAWRAGMTSVIVGAITAYYLGPIAVAMMDPALRQIIPEAAQRAAVGGFLVGCGGILVVGYVIDKWEAARRRGENEEDKSDGA